MICPEATHHGCPQDFIGSYTKVTVTSAALGGEGLISITKQLNKIIGPPPNSPENKLLACMQNHNSIWGVWGSSPRNF